MRNDIYPKGTVSALLDTELVTSETRNVLKERLARKAITEPFFFDKETFIILHAVCNRLLPQNNMQRTVDLAGCIDSILAEGKGNGWRYNEMPPDDKAYQNGLYGINETSKIMFGADFTLLDEAKQDEVLHSIQINNARGKTWETTPAHLFFEELLAQIAELYYGHPHGAEEIGEVAMADAKGWQNIGLNELEAHEPELLNKTINVKSQIPEYEH